MFFGNEATQLGLYFSLLPLIPAAFFNLNECLKSIRDL